MSAQPPDYDEDEDEDPYLPDGVHHEDMPLTDNDKQIQRSLSEMFANAWIH